MNYIESLTDYVAMFDKYARKHGENTTSLMILINLYYNKNGIKQYEICEKIFVTKQVVNVVIKKFCEKNLLQTETCKYDKRRKILKLNEKGIEYAKNILKELEECTFPLTKTERENLKKFNKNFSSKLKKLIEEEKNDKI